MVGKELTLTGWNFDASSSITIELGDGNFADTIVSNTTDTIVASFANYLAPGDYTLKATFDGTQRAWKDGDVTVPETISGTSQDCGYHGGCTLTVTAHGLKGTDYTAEACGIPLTAIADDSTDETLVFEAPKISASSLSAENESKLSLDQNVKIPSDNVEGDNTVENANVAFDSHRVQQYESPNSACWVMQNAHDGHLINASKVKVYLSEFAITTQDFIDSLFLEGRLNGNWNLLHTFDDSSHSGWNVIEPTSGTWLYDSIRVRGEGYNSCSDITEVEVYGYEIYQTSDTDISCPIKVNGQDAGFIEYKFLDTAVITAVDPTFSASTGGQLIEVTGENL